MAEASHRVMTRSGAASTLLVSPIGCDPFGSMLVEETKKLGMRTDGLVQTDLRTAVCNMMLDNNGDLTCGVADMDITVAFDGAEVSISLKNSVVLRLIVVPRLSHNYRDIVQQSLAWMETYHLIQSRPL